MLSNIIYTEYNRDQKLGIIDFFWPKKIFFSVSRVGQIGPPY